MVIRVLAGLIATLLPLAVATAQGQDSTATSSNLSGSTLAGVYTESQATKGAQTYQKNCTGCHAPVAYSGLAFKRVWTGRSVYDLFNLIRTTMPNDNPGKLSRGQYAAIIAYVLRLNGQPPGARDLPDDDEPLKQIRIEIQR